MKKILYFFFIVLFILSVYPIIFNPPIQISNDSDFLEVNTWEIGFYNAGSNSSLNHNNGTITMLVIDKTDDDLLGWGFIHQGKQPHGWGKYAPFEPSLKNEIDINPNDYFSLILKIKLRRSRVEWLNGSIPNWLSNDGFKAHVQIGLALFFEVEGKNYSAPTIEYDTNFQFEVTFLRCRLTNDNQAVYLGDNLRFRTPEYDNDTHNLFSLKQMASDLWIIYEINLTPYLKRAWMLCKDLFKADKIRLKWINFYVEVLNAKLQVDVDYIDLIYKEEFYSRASIIKLFGIILVLLILVFILGYIIT